MKTKKLLTILDRTIEARKKKEKEKEEGEDRLKGGKKKK